MTLNREKKLSYFQSCVYRDVLESRQVGRTFKVLMLPSIFEKLKTCSNRTKSLLIVDQSNTISKIMRILLWNGVLPVNVNLLSTIL